MYFPTETAVKMQTQEHYRILKRYQLAVKSDVKVRIFASSKNNTDTLWNGKLKSPQRGPMLDGVKSKLNPSS